MTPGSSGGWRDVVGTHRWVVCGEGGCWRKRDPHPLTRRQETVLDLMTEGLANKQIAWRLGVSTQTVKNHLRAAFHRLGVSGRVQAAVWWHDHAAAVRHQPQERTAP